MTLSSSLRGTLLGTAPHQIFELVFIYKPGYLKAENELLVVVVDSFGV